MLRILLILSLVAGFSVSSEAQRRVSLQRSLERSIDTLGQPIDSAFITTDSLGRQNYVTLDSTRRILGVDTLTVTGQHFFNSNLTQGPGNIKHTTTNGATIEIKGVTSWLWDDPASWEVDSYTSGVGGRIDIGSTLGTGVDIQGDDITMRLRNNQATIESDDAFFQVSDFGNQGLGPGRIVFRADEYRFSDGSGSGNQYPAVDNTLDSVVVLDAAGFMHVRGVSTLIPDPAPDTLYSDNERVVGVYDMGGTTRDVYEISFEVNGLGSDFQTPYKNPTEVGLRVLDCRITWYYDNLGGNSTGTNDVPSQTTDFGRWYWDGTVGNEYLYIDLDPDGSNYASGLLSDALITIRFIRP